MGAARRSWGRGGQEAQAGTALDISNVSTASIDKIIIVKTLYVTINITKGIRDVSNVSKADMCKIIIVDTLYATTDITKSFLDISNVSKAYMDQYL